MERGKQPDLTAEQRAAAAAMLLPYRLRFKRVQTDNRTVKNHRRLKTLLQQEEFHLQPSSEPTCAPTHRCLQHWALTPSADVSIEAPPSSYPPKKYCDLTGLPAKYTDPVTKLRYADAVVYERVRLLSPEAVQGYLALRRAQVVLK